MKSLIKLPKLKSAIRIADHIGPSKGETYIDGFCIVDNSLNRLECRSMNCRNTNPPMNNNYYEFIFTCPNTVTFSSFSVLYNYIIIMGRFL